MDTTVVPIQCGGTEQQQKILRVTGIQDTLAVQQIWFAVSAKDGHSSGNMRVYAHMSKEKDWQEKRA